MTLSVATRGYLIGNIANVVTRGFLPAAVTVPDAPTIGTATAGDRSAVVYFTPPLNNGGSAITGYTATSTPSSITASDTSNPIIVSGLTNGVSYTFTVHATNAIGNSAESAASNAVTPNALSGMTDAMLRRMRRNEARKQRDDRDIQDILLVIGKFINNELQ